MYICCVCFFFFKQKTAYELRISDWSSDVCSSDLRGVKVLSLDLDEVDGLAAKVRRKDRDAARVIVIKRSSWSERKRFNLAHELGHMVIAPSAGVDEANAAHRFAGAFLMPAAALRAEAGATRSSNRIGELVASKKPVVVSIHAMTSTCQDPGIHTTAAYAARYNNITN